MENWIEIGEHNRENPIVVNLLADEEAINIKKESEKTDWEYLFTQFPKFDVPPNYQAGISDFDPIKTHIETEIIGKKIWLADKEKDRPGSIIIYLLANGERISTLKVTAETDWEYRFTNVPTYDAQGEKIEYSLKEEAIEGYKTTYEGYNIINHAIN